MMALGAQQQQFIRRVAAAVCVAATALSAITLATPSTSAMPLACSAGPDWDAVAESDVIVAGRITGYRRAPEFTRSPMFTPIELQWDIDRVLKGRLDPSDRIVDAASLIEMTDEGGATTQQWAGSGGACGALDGDPTGLYAILGLWRSPDGALTTSLPRIFYLGTSPYSDADVRALQARVAALPAAGSGRDEAEAGAWAWLAVLAGGAGFAAAAAGVALSGAESSRSRARRGAARGGAGGGGAV